MIGIGEGSSGTLKTLVITVGAGATPTASLFSATPTSGPAPLTVRFTGIGSGASIDLGNGVTSQWIDGTPSYINYTYQTAGTYTATLRGQGGALGTVTITAY
jgi:PKD repeat protein